MTSKGVGSPGRTGLAEGKNSEAVARRFHELLRDEVLSGNPLLSEDEQRSLQDHYPLLMDPGRFPPSSIAAVYSRRRAAAVTEIDALDRPTILDSGCGFGSDSLLFAARGARVIAVDQSSRSIEVAEKRRVYFEDLLATKLEIHFMESNLEELELAGSSIALTWMASVLAAIQDQAALLRRIADATLPTGRIMITDMNLLNPRFLFYEWQRRRYASKRLPKFAARSDFRSMFLRRDRDGAVYHQHDGETVFDDVQFFWQRTLRRLLESVGFGDVESSFSAFVPPRMSPTVLGRLEPALALLPLIRNLGYFYLVAARRRAASTDTTGDS